MLHQLTLHMLLVTLLEVELPMNINRVCEQMSEYILIIINAVQSIGLLKTHNRQSNYGLRMVYFRQYVINPNQPTFRASDNRLLSDFINGNSTSSKVTKVKACLV